MTLEIDPLRRSHSDTLPSLFGYERIPREGEQFQRLARHSMSTASPISPTNAMYTGPPYATPPESRKNSKEDGRLPSLHEVGLAAPPPTQHPGPALYPPLTSQYSHHSPSSHNPSPTHSAPPVHSYQASQHPHPQYTPQNPTAPHSSESSSFRYHETRNHTEYPSTQGPPLPPPPPPQPVHPNSEGFRQPHPFTASQPTPAASQYSPRSAPPPPPPPPPPPATAPVANGANTPFNFTPTSTQAQYHYPAPPVAAPPTQSTIQSPYPRTIPPPFTTYANDVNGPHPPYAPGTSPQQSNSLGKRPAAAYGNAIDRALQVSSVRRDLEIVRNTSHFIYTLVQPLYESEGGSNHHQSLDQVVAGFQRAVQDIDQLREGLENCKRVLADMSKEFEEKSLQKHHGSEYDTEEHNYDDGRSVGPLQPEMKKVRRGRAAPPGRCHSCHRAETPEWRRGPDGARTLCNACGLHYAKLTRKMNKNNLAPGSITRKPGPTSPLS